MRSRRPVSPFLTVNATSGKHALGINFTGAFIVNFCLLFFKHLSLFSGISFALQAAQHLDELR